MRYFELFYQPLCREQLEHLGEVLVFKDKDDLAVGADGLGKDDAFPSDTPDKRVSNVGPCIVCRIDREPYHCQTSCLHPRPHAEVGADLGEDPLRADDRNLVGADGHVEEVVWRRVHRTRERGDLFDQPFVLAIDELSDGRLGVDAVDLHAHNHRWHLFGPALKARERYHDRGDLHFFFGLRLDFAAYEGGIAREVHIPLRAGDQGLLVIEQHLLDRIRDFEHRQIVTNITKRYKTV